MIPDSSKVQIIDKTKVVNFENGTANRTYLLRRVKILVFYWAITLRDATVITILFYLHCLLVQNIALLLQLLVFNLK